MFDIAMSLDSLPSPITYQRVFSVYGEELNWHMDDEPYFFILKAFYILRDAWYSTHITTLCMRSVNGDSPRFFDTVQTHCVSRLSVSVSAVEKVILLTYVLYTTAVYQGRSP